MGRITPLDGDPGIHPALTFSFVMAATAATIAIISGLCGLWGKSSSQLSSENENDEKSAETDADANAAATTTTTASTASETEENQETKGLPPPPCMETGATTKPSDKLMKKSASTRKSSVLSVKKHFRSLSVRDVIEKKRPHLHNKSEDSLWKKPIILGDKCKVPHDRNYDDEDDHDGSGIGIGNDNPNAVETFRSRTQSNISSENQHCLADNIIDKDKGTTRKEEQDS